MLRYIDHKKMGRGIHDWLDSHFHFSFAEYYNPANIHFGILRVVNDDIVQPHTGFDTHPHRDMEIISYVIKGELTHIDSMGNERKLKRGQVQYMSAGTGVQHSEYNLSDEPLRLLQIWILPDKKGYKPNYDDFEFDWQERENKWLHLASSYEGSAPVSLHADVNIYVSEISNDNRLDFEVGQDRQAYLVLIEGSAKIDGIDLNERDALEIVEEDILIEAKETAHVLIIEMKKG